MKGILLFLIINLCCSAAKSQEKVGLTIKTSLLNLVAKRPSFSIEKSFKSRYGLELSYTTGILNWGRDYEYDGFLLRAKWYVSNIDVNEVTPFLGIYAGNLNKNIISNNAYVHPTGFLSFGSNRNFKANSIRSGVNMGLLYLPTKRFLIETTTGLGYGKYFDVKTFQGRDAPNGYLDFQLWLSIGYRF